MINQIAGAKPHHAHQNFDFVRYCVVFLSVLYPKKNYNDVIMSTMASQITSLTIVYATVYSGVVQRKHQRSASLAYVQGIHRWAVNSPHKETVTRKIFPFDDVIMVDANFLCHFRGHLANIIGIYWILFCMDLFMDGTCAPAVGPLNNTKSYTALQWLSQDIPPNL